MAIGEELEEDRNYAKSPNPYPIINMGVEIHPEWSDKFHQLANLLKKTPKETINWIVNQYMFEHLP